LTRVSASRAAALLLLGSAFVVVGIGLYFAFLRPPLLAEDYRFIGASPEAVAVSLPGLAGWLRHVFVVMGGFVVATGLLTAYLACLAFRSAPRGIWSVALASGVASTGTMAAVNFAIDSDFKWFLLGVAALWAAALALRASSSSIKENAHE
jgi:hypothetical protein